MKRIPWRKMPTVLTGGKPFFYVRHIGTLKQSIVWVRHAHGYMRGTWAYSENDVVLHNNDRLTVLKRKANVRRIFLARAKGEHVCGRACRKAQAYSRKRMNH